MFYISVCPLVFPDMRHVTKDCGNGISNRTACCNAMESYVSHLQKQSFITNLQALDCAASLGMKLRRLNITTDVYGLCHIGLKDFSLQGMCCLSSMSLSNKESFLVTVVHNGTNIFFFSPLLF